MVRPNINKPPEQSIAVPGLFPPAVWQSLRFEWLWVYRGFPPIVETWSQEITVPPGWFWVESGLVKIQADGHELLVEPGQSFFTAPGTRRQWFAKGTKLLSVGFRCERPGGAPVFKTGLNAVLSKAKSSALHSATQVLFKAVHGRKEIVTYQGGTANVPRSISGWCQHESAFRQWFGTYVQTLETMGISPQSSSSEDRRSDSMLKALSDWPLDEPLKLARLAADMKLSERRVHDLLRARLGMTAQIWIERRRLDAARQQLTGGDSALKEIAFALGFKHPPHFTAWFKRHTGMTPTAFRDAGGVSGA